jgi:hypothetical protein
MTSALCCKSDGGIGVFGFDYIVLASHVDLTQILLFDFLRSGQVDGTVE